MGFSLGFSGVRVRAMDIGVMSPYRLPKCPSCVPQI